MKFIGVLVALIMCFVGGFFFKDNKYIGLGLITVGAVIWAVLL